jgi:hypothetical protein
VRYQATTVLASAGDPAATGVADNGPPSADLDIRGDSLYHAVENGAENAVPQVGATPVLVRPAGFDGVSYLDQRSADGGHNRPATNPDQALCVGNGFVLQGVNNALRVYDLTGSPLTGAVALGPFFGDGHEIISRHPLVLGGLHSDPRCVFDPDTGRFFVTALRYHKDPATGNLIGTASVELAVSQTGDPRGAWDVYVLDSTSDGANGSPAVSGCPCLGDFPVIGTDANGIYITTTLWSDQYLNAGQQGGDVAERFMAISKARLVHGTASTAVMLTLPRTDPSAPFPANVDPATIPPGGAYDTADGGTEYLTAACGNTLGTIDEMFLFALTNTSSLDRDSPSLSLSQQFVGTEQTFFNAPFGQREGYRPLADWIQLQTGGAEPPLEIVDPGPECSQLSYADGRLWTARSTEVKLPTGTVRNGLAWFQIVPTVAAGQVSGQVVNQGYVGIDRNNTVDGSIAVDRTGHGVIAFGIYGPDYYPSAAYVPIDEHGTGSAVIVGQGQVPLDNYDGYAYFGSSSRDARYGDYAAAVATGDGDFWIAQEYMPNIPRTRINNWGTRIAEVH